MSIVSQLANEYIDDRLEQIHNKAAFVDGLPDVVKELDAVKVTMPTERMVVIEVFRIDQGVVDYLVRAGWTAKNPTILGGHKELTLTLGFGKSVIFKEQCQACYERKQASLTESEE